MDLLEFRMVKRMSEEQKLRNELQQLSSQLQQFDGYGKQLQTQIESLQSYLIELSRIKITLTGLKEELNAEEFLLKLGSGIMIRAKPLDAGKVLANIGAGVTISKTVDEAINDITKQIDEAEKERLALADQLAQVINQINLLERRAQSVYRQLQGPSKPSYDPDLVS